MIILEIFDNSHYIQTEIDCNYPRQSQSTTSHHDILQRLSQDTFLPDLGGHIERKYNHKSFQHPVLTSLLCESNTRKSIKEVLRMKEINIFRTRKTLEVINEIRSDVKDMKDDVKDVKHSLQNLQININNNSSSSSSLLALKQLLIKKKQDLEANLNVSKEQLEQKLNHLQSFIETSDNQFKEWRQTNKALKLEDVKSIIEKLEEKVDDGFKNIRVDMNNLSETIVDELNDDNLDRYTEMKIIMSQIQSSIPKDRATMEHFISTELSRVMTCVQNQSSKTEIVNLRDSLLYELTSQQRNLDDITSQLEKGFSVLQESLGKVHSKLDLLTQSMVDFQLDFSTQLDTSKKEEIDLEDIEDFISDLGSTKKKIQKLLGREVKNKDVKNLIDKLTNSLESLEISSEESLNQLKEEFKSKCSESQENQDELKQLLLKLSQIVSTVNEKMGSLRTVTAA